jgi:hypothetical protein
VSFQQGGSTLRVRLQKTPRQPLPTTDPRVVVVAEQVGRHAENQPCHRQTLDAVARVGEIVQCVRQPVPPRLDRVRLQRRRPLAEVRLGQGAGAPGFTVRIDQDETRGVHALKDRTACGDVGSEEFHETGTGVNEELHDTAFEPDRLSAGLAAVLDERRDVQVTAGSGAPGSRRAGKDDGERIGETVTGETSRLVDVVDIHAGRVPGTLADGDWIHVTAVSASMADHLHGSVVHRSTLDRRT